MKFTKMHGTGNDYIFISTFDQEVPNPSELAIRLSNRNFGIGSDGLILITPSEAADVGMRMFHSDGTEYAMCGNSIRCVGKYAYDNGLCRESSIRVETPSGVKTLGLDVKDGKVRRVTVDMGEPELRPERIPLAGHDGEQDFINQYVAVDGWSWPMTAVSLGTPHAVMFLDPVWGMDLPKLDFERLGPLFEHHELFPQRTNVEFVQAENRSSLRMRVWERGVGETLASGTGACAATVAGVLTGLCNRSVRVFLPGGRLDILWQKTDNHVVMTGEAVTVFSGELYGL